MQPLILVVSISFVSKRGCECKKAKIRAMQLTTRFYCVKTRLVRPNVSACLGGGNGFFCRSSLKATQRTQIYDSGYEVSSLAKKQEIKFNTNRKSDFQELFFEVQSFQKNQLFIIQTSSQVMLNDRDTNNLWNAVQCKEGCN